jgi:acyl-CoA thioesterase
MSLVSCFRSCNYQNWCLVRKIITHDPITVDESLLNFHGTPHGGAVYSLADAAFAAASNARGETAVALETNISYLEAADTGETLTATAEKTHDGGRTAEYEVLVTNAADDRVAAFRGRVYRPR